MGSAQIVFLFDLNGCYLKLARCKEALNEKLINIRLACLRLLTDFANKTSNLRWGLKFFDSSGAITQTMNKSAFTDLSLESFETFENEICIRYERHVSYFLALAEPSQSDMLAGNSRNNCEKDKHHISPVKILQLAITQILSEFQWEYVDIWSPSAKMSNENACHLGKRNILVLFGDFADDEKMLLHFFGLDNVPSKSKFSNMVLPLDLRKKLLEKVGMHWIWVNIAQNQNFLVVPSSKTLQLLSAMLKSIQGSLIPLSLLSQSVYHVKFMNCSKRNGSPSSILNAFNNSLLPFTTIYHHSLHHPFYCSTNESIVCSLNLICFDVQIPIQLIQILNRYSDSPKEDEHAHADSSCDKSNISFTKWSKIIVQGCVSKTVKYSSHEIFLCLPHNSDVCALKDFSFLIKALSLREVNLALTCVTDNGLHMLGLLVPLSNDAAVLSVIHPLVSLLDIKIVEKNVLECENGIIEEVFKELEDEPSKILSSSKRQFQMECLAHWYKPISVSKLSLGLESVQSSNSSKVESFYKLLRQSVRDDNNTDSGLVVENVLHISGSNLPPESQIKEENEFLIDSNLDEVLSTLKNIYNSAIESSISILDCAKKVVKIVSHYFKKHGGSSFEENVIHFMKENFFMTARRISEKYEMLQSDEDRDKRIRECQLQVFLALETEALTLPPDKSSCVKTVTSILRMMSFYTGAIQLNKLLSEIVRENYSNKLYDVLVDIGDELDIPIFEEDVSSNSPDILSSELVDGELFGSAVLSDISVRSSSSACSRQVNDRKLTRYRSDISDTTRSRQVLLPKTSPKKKKGKSSAQKKAVRCSPRLAAQKSERSLRSKEENHKSVCRNLFPKEKLHTPRKNNCTTPKSKKKNCASKTKFVAETPAHKQNHSAFQRRKSYVEQQSFQNLPKEIAESPKTTTIGSNEELLQKLRKNHTKVLKTKELSVEKTKSPFKFMQYTPESKRRLSLKLFSKLLSSPTARMGIKKCTKRLFDQVSPSKSGGSYKKYKSLDESELVSSTKKLGFVSHLPNSDV